MAPSFFSRFTSNSKSPSRSTTPPEEQGLRARALSAPIKRPPPNIFIESESPKTSTEESNRISDAPNFTIIPPSPSMTAQSLANSSGDETGSKTGVSNGSRTIKSPGFDNELTPTARRSPSFLRNSSSTGNLKDLGNGPSPNGSSAHGRFATIAASGPGSIRPSTADGNLSKSSSKSSLRIDVDTPTIEAPMTMTPMVDSPTSSSPPPIQSTFSNGTLLVPRQNDGDNASIRSTTSRKPWSRNRSDSKSTSPTKARSKSPKRKPTGLAGAIAASGLAMAQGLAPDLQNQIREQMTPQQRSATMMSRHVQQRSLEIPSSASKVSVNNYHTDYSDAESGSDSDTGSELDDVLQDLAADNIPVTGFAVASSKRNADFHELFPEIPEGDYLIEDYGCALQRDILVQGRLYVSENHVCFHANIFGWITDLSIPMSDILNLEKKMTAFVIPNAIQLSTRATKYTFASFLSRDNTFDVIYNIWRLARPDDSRNPSVRGSMEESARPPLVGNASGSVRAPPKVTQCACGRNGLHYSETALETVLPGTPEKIHNLMFASGFIKNFMSVDQKLIDLQISDWVPAEGASDPKLLGRNMSYIKPLNGSIGPKQTKCELRDEIASCDFDEYVSTMTTTRTPDVPSGNVFSVKTRTCITWASHASSRVVVTTQVEWTGRSFIKGIIERSCIDGQKTYHADLDKAMRVYIQDHLSEFIPEGMDEEEAEAAQVAEIAGDAPQTPKSPEEARKAREHERNQRGLQWAYDTFEGAFKVAKQSTETALELVTDAWDQSSSAAIPWFIISALVISNIWTLLMVGGREEVGRRKEAMKMEEREKWVQGVVTGIWDELNVRGKPQYSVPSHVQGVVSDWREEVAEINKALDAVEERVRNVRASLKIEDLD